ERGAQGLVAAHDLGQGAGEGGEVEPTAEAEGVGEVVAGVARGQLIDHPEPLLGEGAGQGATPRFRRERRYRRGRGGVARRGGGASPRAERCAASTAAARPATVGASNRVRRGRSTPSPSRTRAITWVARSECPPRSKKLSWIDSRSRPSTCAQRSATTSSTGV